MTFYIYFILYLLYTQQSYFPFLVFHKCNNLTTAKFHLLTPPTLYSSVVLYFYLHMFSASLYRVFIFALSNYLSFKQAMRRKEKESYFRLFIISSDLHFFLWIQVSICITSHWPEGYPLGFFFYTVLLATNSLNFSLFEKCLYFILIFAGYFP